MSQDLSPSFLFIWDAANIDHIARHNVTPEEVEEAFENGAFRLATENRKAEERTTYFGETDTGRILRIVVCSRAEKTRVVTAHPANRHTRKAYETFREARDAKLN